MKKKYVLFILLFVVIIGGIIFVLTFKHDNTQTDASKFASEYTLLDKDNVFVYRSGEEILNILEHGTGVVFLGFPECPWCQRYAFYLNDIAKENNISKIYYYNIKEDRANNTVIYQKIVKLLNEHLLYDDEGKRRIYVPDVTFVKEGAILGHDNETSFEPSVTDDKNIPLGYWTDEKVDALKTRLGGYMKNIKINACVDCAN